MKRHVFLIDDDIEEMRFFVGALNEMGDGYKCTYASNGSHALKMLQYLKPETIFINYNMPGMNGVELTAELRKNKVLESIPVFLFFPTTDQHNRQKTMAMSDIHCLDKPGNKADMVIVLKNVFESSALYPLLM